MSDNLWELFRRFQQHQIEHAQCYNECGWPGYINNYDPKSDQGHDPKIISDTESRLEIHIGEFALVVRPWGWTVYDITESNEGEDSIHHRGTIQDGTILYKHDRP